ncbi:Nucleolar protein 9 [Coemansia sp. RSA 986]|nr:Nucleolar protein 9 [Coemansia sp. RSA 986]
MGVEGKRKTRRGKRGGESKRKENDNANGSNKEHHDKQQDDDVVMNEATTGEYIPPPMESKDPLFYYDTNAPQDEESQDPLDKISPASYGLVNPDLQKYLKSCEGMLDDQAFESAEDRDIFINNVYSEMKNFELQLTTDHECSRILEKLFRISSNYQIRRFFSLTKEDTTRLVVHRFSSHTIQTLLLLSAIALGSEMRDETADDFTEAAANEEDDAPQAIRTKLPTFEELILSLTNALTDQWSYMMANEYASHILRVLLLVLAGKPIEDQKNPKSAIKSKRSAKYMEDRNAAPISHRVLGETRPVPESFGRALDELLSTVGNAMSDYSARSSTNSVVGSPVLQLMLELQAPKPNFEQPGALLDKCLMGLITDGGASKPNARRNAYIEMMLEDVVGSHFLQTVARTVSSSLFQIFYQQFVAGKIRRLAFHPIANFVVQSVFSCAKNKQQLDTMVKEAGPMFGDLLFKNRPGVVRALIDSSVRLQAGYKEIIRAIYSGLDANTREERIELINLLAFLIKYPDFVSADYNTLPFKIQGSLIIQSILQLPGDGQDPILESFFGQDPARMYSWCKDPSGSRIIETILASMQIPTRTKRMVREQFSGHYADLALDRCGSHIVDAAWKTADIAFKESIVLELLQKETQLQDSQLGRIMLRNCGAEHYKRRADQWRERERGLERKKHMFKDILGDKLVLNENKAPASEPASENPQTKAPTKKNKRKTNETDEIDALFKKTNKRVVSIDLNRQNTQATAAADTEAVHKQGAEKDKSLDAVMDAIAGTKRKSKKKNKDKSTDEPPTSKKSKKAKEEQRKQRRAFTS